VKRPANDIEPTNDLMALVDDLAALAVEFHLDGRFEESVDVLHEKERADERDPGLDEPAVPAGG
jgi:hypothetical protein